MTMGDSDYSDLSDKSFDEEENENPCPKTITGTNEYTDVYFHPTKPKLLATDISGYIMLYSYNCGEACTEEMKVRISKKPCRCASFSSDGEDIIALAKDKTMQIIATSTGRVKRKIQRAHSSPPHCMAVINQYLVATGDDDGILKLWDLRRHHPVMEENVLDDYVSSIAVDDINRLIFAVSGDGTMTSYNARQRKFKVQSEGEKSPLHCVQVMKGNNKLVVGSGSGDLLIYNWEEFAATSDRFPVHPGSLECMARVTDDVVCVGSDDGLIRAIHILPNRVLSTGDVVWRHGESVDRLRCGLDGKILASTAFDRRIRFWNASHLHNVLVDGQEKADKHIMRTTNGRSAFMADIDKDFEAPHCDVDSDDSSDDVSG